MRDEPIDRAQLFKQLLERNELPLDVHHYVAISEREQHARGGRRGHVHIVGGEVRLHNLAKREQLFPLHGRKTFGHNTEQLLAVANLDNV